MARYFYDLDPEEKAPVLFALRRGARELTFISALFVGAGYAALVAVVLFVFTSASAGVWIAAVGVTFVYAGAAEWFRRRTELRRVNALIEVVAKEMSRRVGDSHEGASADSSISSSREGQW